MATNVTPIDLPFPDADPLELRLALGPARVHITAGATGWASGRYEDPTGLLPLQVTQDAGRARIAQTPSARSRPSATRAPSLELALGAGRPYQLVIDGGANETIGDFGGLPLTRLTIHYGAGRADLDFSAPNPGQMTALDLSSGGVAMDLRNLANANFAEMVASGGAGQYRLDFGGELKRDAAVRLNTGVASVELRLPAGTAAQVRTETVLGSMDVGDGFVTREGGYWNEAAAAGRTPLIRIVVNSVLGSVSLRTA